MNALLIPLSSSAPQPTLAASTTPMPELTQTLSNGFESAGKAAKSLLNDLPIWGTKLLLAGLVILIGILVMRLGHSLIKKIFKRRVAAKDIRFARQTDTLRTLIKSVFDYIMYFFIITAVFGLFGVNLASLLAVAGVGGIAVAFGAQTLVKDVIGGVFLWLEGNVVVGDLVEINTLSGEVEAVALRTTTLRNVNGNLYIIPNGEIRTIVNMTRNFKRALVDIPVPYEANLDKVLAILRDEMALVPDCVEGVLDTPDVQGVLSFDSSCIRIRIVVDCPVKENWRIERELRKRVKDRFDREGIEMPHSTVVLSQQPPQED
ncbi:MAG: mechanosensitive ion channel family protein [Clostridia bacterium]